MKPKVFALVVLVTVVLGGCSSKSSDNPTVGAGQASGATTTLGSTGTTAASSSSATTATTTATTTAAGGGLTGTWSGDYQQTAPSPDSGTFTLHWQQSGSNVTGTIDIAGACSACPISATVNGSSVTFGVVALGGITYTGTVSGNTMSGTYATADSSYKGTWKASKTG